jgi:peptidoglycan/LPS O-acetylase OafA/YrhL
MNVKVRKAIHHLPAATVFGVAAWQSYWHTVEVAIKYGEASSAYIMPFSIDGLMIVAARYMSHAKTRAGRILAAVWFGVGVVATLGINILAADPNPISVILAALPAAGMVGVAAMLHWSPQAAQPVRKRRAPAARGNVTKLDTKRSRTA